MGERTTRQSLAITTTAFGLGLAALVLVSANLITMLAVAPRAGAAPVAYQNPVSPLDAPDPDIVFVNGEYYAFTTGGAYGHIQEFTSSDLVNWTPRPNPGALVSEPGWVNPGLEWAPSVGQFANTWVMLYATFDEWLDAECVTEATAPAVGGPYVNDAQGPLLCQPLLGAGGILYGGDIDPDLFVSNGVPYLLWKANPAGFTTQAALWSEQLSPDGLSLAPGSSPNELLEQDQSWESTIENPDMVEENGVDYLFYSGGNWWDSTYAVGYAVCAGVAGPCGTPTDTPVLSSSGPVVGPGGEWAFTDASGQWWMAYAGWTLGAVGYPSGARSLRIDPLCFANGAQGGPATPMVLGPSSTPEPLAPSCPTLDPASSYQMVAADGGLFSFGDAAFFGSGAQSALKSPVVAMADDPGTGGYWEVTAKGSVSGYHAPVLGDPAGSVLGAPIVGMAATPDGEGYWLVGADGGVYAYGDANFFGSAGGIALASPIVGMAATPDGGGYWLVAADGGIFAYGDANFFGSMGGRPLNQRIVGMAAMPDGGGYWLVAADGGLFSFGDAPFRGSTGGMALNKPIVGMAVDGDGGGYWLVASDGGIFAYGSAGFEGSTGSLTLNQPIVGMVAS